MTAHLRPQDLNEFCELPLALRPGGTLQVGSSPRSQTLVGPISAADLATLRIPPQDGRRRGATAQRRILEALLRAGSVPVGRLRSSAAALRVEPGQARTVPDAVAWTAWDSTGPEGVRRLAARGERSVAVVGTGRVGATIAGLLAASGIGTVLCQDPGAVTAADLTPTGLGPEQLGRPRGLAAEERLRPWLPDPSASSEGACDLVVLVDSHVARARTAAGLVTDGVAHLSVVVRDTDAVVGPLVVPGAGPCLRCLDLRRTEGDPAWPLVLDQLATAPPAPEETAAAALVAGTAALQVLCYLDGVPASSEGGTLEIALPEGWVSLRVWSAHPACGCGALAGPDDPGDR